MDISTRLTGDDLLKLTGHFELNRGELVPMTPPGYEHGDVTLSFAAVLRPFIRSNQLGNLVTESGFYLRRDPDTVRGPDLSFFEANTLQERWKGYAPVPPVLAIEVVSPNDSSEETAARVRELLSAGLQEVWLAYPTSQELHRFFADGSARVLRPDDELAGEPLLPGLLCQVRLLFNS